jgi:hypothetical protein
MMRLFWKLLFVAVVGGALYAAFPDGGERLYGIYLIISFFFSVKRHL